MKRVAERVSVIVPIYNEEKRIGNCLDSIINQTYENMEIILINDGSTDRSLEICQEYADHDSRINLIDCGRAGVVNARNQGLRNATGNYITYVDSDDWIEDAHIKRLIDTVENYRADVVCFGLKRDREEGIFEESFQNIPEGVYEGEELIHSVYTRMLYTGEYYKFGILPCLWAKIFKKTVLEQVSYKVDSRIILGEDGAVTYPALLKAKRIVISPETTYHYYDGQGERRNLRDRHLNESLYYLHKVLYEAFENNENSDILLKQLRDYTSYMAVDMLKKTYGIALNICNIVIEYPEAEGKDVIVYGGGKTGREIYKSMILDPRINVVGWVDKNYQNKNHKLIQSPQIISKIDFDYIILAVRDQKVALEIEEELVCKGMEKNRILWKPVQYEIRYE